MSQQTPQARGFRMPAEWEPHEATWIAWPHNREDWPGRFAPIPWVYGEIVRKLAAVEKVRILVQSAALEKQARRVLERVRRQPGRGGILPARDRPRLDARLLPALREERARQNRADRVALQRLGEVRRLAQGRRHPGLPRRTPEAALRSRPEMVLEGGSIDVNGQGLLLTTEECLLSPVQARNPGMTREEIERRLADYLGAARVIWLKNGIAGDDTHGHVDDLARFVKPDTVVLCAESDPADAVTAAARRAQGGAPADAASAAVRRAATARQLREFLHRQRAGAGADL